MKHSLLFLCLIVYVNAFLPTALVRQTSSSLGTTSQPSVVQRNRSLTLGSTKDKSSDGSEPQVSELLDRALNADTDATSSILSQINNLRQAGGDGNAPNQQDELTNFLDGILSLVDGAKMPIWTKIRITSKISRRARRVALRRLLDISTPSAPDDNDTDEAKQGRRRRALVVALRSLMPSEDGDEMTKGKDASPSIYTVEKAARKDLKTKISTEDMKSRIPPGLETPKYDVIVKRNKYEVREYESFSVCSVPMAKPRPDASSTDRKVSQPQLAGASSFGALAGYLFGKNEEKVAMKMTTPVLTTGEGDDKEMAFVLPSEYWEDDLSKAPSPLQNSLVQLKKDAGGNRAVTMFGGFVSSKEAEAKKKELLANLESDKDWAPVEGALATIAQYNDPFTPPWRRLSEVSIQVKPRQ